MRLHNPRIGQTPTRKLLLPPRIFTPEDYAFGNRAVMELLSYFGIDGQPAGWAYRSKLRKSCSVISKHQDYPIETSQAHWMVPVESLPRLREFLAKL